MPACSSGLGVSPRLSSLLSAPMSTAETSRVPASSYHLAYGMDPHR